MLVLKILAGWFILSLTAGPIFVWAFFYPIRREKEMNDRFEAVNRFRSGRQSAGFSSLRLTCRTARNRPSGTGAVVELPNRPRNRRVYQFD